MPIQLSLDLSLVLNDLPEKEYWRQYRTPEQEEEFQLFLAQMRKETAEWLTLANELMPEQKFTKLTELTVPQLAQVSSVYFPDSPDSPDSQLQQLTPQPPNLSKPAKPYRPWSDERKFLNRIRRLTARVEKDFSIPEMRIAKLLDLCADNAQYLGLCLLPILGTDRCQVSFNIAQITALEKEKMLRNHEV